MQEIKDRIEQIVLEALETPDLYIVEINIGRGSTVKVEVLLDGDNGITIDQCAKVSRSLGHYMEEEELMDVAYRLEVSSPGVDYPLKGKRQFEKNLGRRLKLKLKEGKEMVGPLDEVKESTILIRSEKAVKYKVSYTPVEVAFSDIEEAIVEVSFN